MKYLKRFENINNNPEIGDYIIIDKLNNILGPSYDDIFYFLNNNIGKVVGFGNVYNGKGIKIKFFNIPKNLNTHFNPDHIKIFPMNSILAFGKNKETVKEEAEIQRNIKKFNL